MKTGLLQLVCVAVAAHAMPMMADETAVDSLQRMDVPHGIFSPVMNDAGVATAPVAGLPDYEPPHGLQDDKLPVNSKATNLPLFNFVPGAATLGQWNGGGVFATGGRTHLYGLMGVENGSVNLIQDFGRVSVSVFGEAEKFGFFRGLSTIYGVGGSVSYRFSNNLSITAFGSYYTSAGVGQPAMMGYVPTTSFGGYLDWRFHEHWGVRTGVQSYRSIAYGRWETQPIVMPYYRTSSGAAIGVDLGGILYQLFQSFSAGRSGNHSNPTIAPPTGPSFSNPMP